MPIVVNLDVVMAQRKISSGELAERVGISQANLSILKTGKAKAIRFSTLEAICEVLQCQPGDILEYRTEEKKNFIHTAQWKREDIEAKKEEYRKTEI
ncbi:MAG: helix-turn-helix domain-containing protein [Oscillospiraceae bacterium]